MTVPGVVGTAVGEFEGEPCITVYVAEKTKALDGKFPAELEGHRICLMEIGEIQAL